MYPVSEAFLQAVQENTRRYYWTGRITTTKGASYEFGADDIVKGSGYISSQSWKIDELVKRTYSDVVHGRFGIGAFAMPVER